MDEFSSPDLSTLSLIDFRASSSVSNTSTDATSISSEWMEGQTPAPEILFQQHMPYSYFIDPSMDPMAMDSMDLPPKSEELEHDIQSIQPAEVENQPHNMAAPEQVPRKRGRPRKHPLPASGGPKKATKGRSKTGCITCRRRKKKCDERKPTCRNCQKNAVMCEGYPIVEIWKNGRQKKLEEEKAACAARCRSLSSIPRTLPALIDGIENELDRRFLNHFVHGFSRVLTLINDDTNPFREILLPMALHHKGLMHSLMCLSGSHLSGIDPDEKLKIRKWHHFHHAIETLNHSIALKVEQAEENEGEPVLVEDPIIASTIALSLNTICEGETSGEYRPHMDAARVLIASQRPRNHKFLQFIVEFFQYHAISNALTSLERRPCLLAPGSRLFPFTFFGPEAVFVGVFDGLFNYLFQITEIRDNIRSRYNRGLDPPVEFDTLSQSIQIDIAIRGWESSHDAGSANWCLAQLYRQCTWVYLYRTMERSVAQEKIAKAVDDGLTYLERLPLDSGAYSIVLMPLFLLGCSSLFQTQRDRIERGFQSLKAYSGLGNIAPSLQVVQTVWEIMDHNIEASWDWEQIIKEMQMDFLIT